MSDNAISGTLHRSRRGGGVSNSGGGVLELWVVRKRSYLCWDGNPCCCRAALLNAAKRLKNFFNALIVIFLSRENNVGPYTSPLQSAYRFIRWTNRGLSSAGGSTKSVVLAVMFVFESGLGALLVLQAQLAAGGVDVGA